MTWPLNSFLFFILKAANTIVEEKSITDSTSSGDESSASYQSDTNNKPSRTNQRRKLRILATSTDTDNDTTITGKITNSDIITSDIITSADKNCLTKVKNDNIDNSSTSTPFIGENSSILDTKSLGLKCDSNSFKNNTGNDENPVALPEIPGNNPVQTPGIIHGKNPVQTPETHKNNPVTNPEIHGKPVKRTIRRTAMKVTCL